MKGSEREAGILTHIIEYCDQIELTMQRFGYDYNCFRDDAIYRNAVALCVLQIGELAGKLSEDFRALHTDVPWKQIRAMRNIVAHAYGSVDSEVTWEIITEDVPTLKRSCQRILSA